MNTDTMIVMTITTLVLVIVLSILVFLSNRWKGNKSSLSVKIIILKILTVVISLDLK